MANLFLSREQVREVDRRAIEEFGLSGRVLMENAGRGCVDVLSGLGLEGPVLVACGRGNNGGDGFVIARHLDLRGYAVRVALFCDPDTLQGDAAANFEVVKRSGIGLDIFAAKEFSSADDARLHRCLEGSDWVVDALLGTGARGEPRPPFDTVIRRLNDQPVRRMAVDVPSGLDCDTGQPASVTFRADHTCTFVAQKSGFAAESARPYLGEVHVLDIGAPRKLLESLRGG
jgi:NAD(P)H-hydrate epimerase